MAFSTSTSKLQSALLAAMVAALIWVFAEGESISTRTVIATVSFANEPAGDILIRPDDSEFHGSAQVRLEGTTRSIDAAAIIVGNSFKIAPGMAGVPNTPGEKRYVNLREAISSIPDLQRMGGMVAGVEPRVVNVHVIKLVSRELPVRVELGGAVVLDTEPVCKPATVTIRVSEQMAARIPDGAFAVAMVSEADLRRLRADVAQSVPAVIRPPVEVAGVDPLVLTPEQASVTLRLKRTVDTLHIPTVPVWFSMPPTEDAGKWIVELQDKFITDVTLSGPTDQLERIRSGKWAVKAMVELTSDELEKGIQSKPAIFPDLPPGVTASANSQIVRFIKVVRREPGH
jgi:hypothetical protein